MYLKQNLIVEPLVNQWYAWSYLIYPITYSMVLSKNHLKIMESFVKAPKIHENSAKRMPGGPFLHCSADRAPEITALIRETREKCQALIDLQEQLTEFSQLLSQENQGDSLERFYEKVPSALKGYVELGYDLYHHPSIRFFEALLYDSEFYRPEFQSLSMFLGDEQNERKFVLSTPRLIDDRTVSIKITFKDPLIDRLASSRWKPADPLLIDDLISSCDQPQHKGDLVRSFFTKQPPRPSANIPAGRIVVRYFNHATVSISTAKTTIMTDPIIGYRWNESCSWYSFNDIPEKIEYVLLTHNHQDHVLLETLLQLRHRIGAIVVPKSHDGFLQDPSIKLILNQCGFQNVVEIGIFDTIEFEDGRITGLPFLGEHGDLHIASKTSFLVEAKSEKMLFAADSNNLQSELYERIARKIGKIDTIFLGMECDGAPLSWLYGAILQKPVSRIFDQNRRLNGSNCERAWKLIKCFSPKRAYVYAMGAEPWIKFISSIQYTDESLPIVESNKLVELCRLNGIASERLFLNKEVVLPCES